MAILRRNEKLKKYFLHCIFKRSRNTSYLWNTSAINFSTIWTEHGGRLLDGGSGILWTVTLDLCERCGAARTRLFLRWAFAVSSGNWLPGPGISWKVSREREREKERESYDRYVLEIAKSDPYSFRVRPFSFIRIRCPDPVCINAMKFMAEMRRIVPANKDPGESFFHPFLSSLLLLSLSFSFHTCHRIPSNDN